MEKIDFVDIVNRLKVEAKDELPSFPEAFYKSFSFIYAAVYNNGDFSTSCSSSVLINANECFMLVTGINNYEAYYHILYYIDENGIPHKEGFIDGRWSIVTRKKRFGSNPYYYDDVLFLKFDNCEISRSEGINVKSNEVAFRDIIGKYLTIRHCKTIDEAKLSIKVLEMKIELQNNKNMTDFIKAYLSEEAQMYHNCLKKIKAVIDK